ncbi:MULTISPECIES: SufE family protein [Hallerella]|uniref:Cysteine desulfuration protein SufE n=1 Tax=Hallerella succinigenes TaxID=1896222 RepID=A0A2M9A455_9BACT|nr:MULTISPECIES: SufE family protein [Hallerella]MCI6874525.1 SufE family protein [Hallerella sp.]MDY5029983.1 SufE family protein [Hallerella succinigenes]PJJ40438.1 cysteine desulfuration protein SufE [Hallerella succinigenes]
MKSILEVEEEIRATFAAFTSSDDKWAYLLKIAREHPGMDDRLKAEKFLVKGCASRMFLVPEFKDGILHLHMDTEVGEANPLISRGLGALALKIYDGRTPEEILSADPAFFQNIGLQQGLSPTRANGFASLLKQIYLYAKVYSALATRAKE